ncbi:MAG: ATP-binding protein [Janthinobacterium lividum]
MRAIDSLFGRLAILVLVVLLIPHFAWYAFARAERAQMRNRFALEETVFLVEAIQEYVQRNPSQPLPPRVGLAPPNAVVAHSDRPLPPTLQHFVDALTTRLPAGSRVVPVFDHHPKMWVWTPGAHHWLILPLQPPAPPPRSFDDSLPWIIGIFMVAMLLALFAAWRLQRPMRALAESAVRFGRGLPVAPLAEGGPRELRQLAQGFNQMVTDISRTEGDRNVMLAGVAHDLRAPLARLRLRAEMVDEAPQREGFVRDVDSLAHIVDQFLVFAHDGGDQSPLVEVDAHCERFVRHHRFCFADQPALDVTLNAGERFVLHSAMLDRILTNLVDNAVAYGAPPIVVATLESADRWYLSVTDNGSGIPLDQLENASRPFVRLDPARGGNAHCGLGLAIVSQLARKAGGDCAIVNLPDGGFRVELSFPRDR